MSRVQRFEDLVIFQSAKKLCVEVYRISGQDVFRSDYRFQQQIRAAVGSIMDNIAEGYERDGNKELLNFLYIAKGSCGEVRSQLIRAKEVGHIDESTFLYLYKMCIGLSKGILAFIQSIKTSDFSGPNNKTEEPLPF